MTYDFDAVVVGSGPNGLAAAIALQQEGLSVKLIEGRDTPGGGMRSMELTEPGFIHDVCSAVHPLGAYSPFLRTLPLDKHGLKWIHPEIPLAHPLPDGSTAILDRSIEKTAEYLKEDGRSYARLMSPVVKNWDKIASEVLGPLKFPVSPIELISFGLKAIQPASMLSRTHFKNELSKALFAGLAAHSIMPLNKPISSAIGLVLGALAHKVGWPSPEGGTQNLADSMVSYFKSLGGVVETGVMVKSIKQLEFARIKLFDITPKQLLNIEGLNFPSSYRKQLQKYRYGAGIFKIDWALKEPIPFKSEECRKAGTVHIGGTFDSIARSERAMWEGRLSGEPYILLTQLSLFDTQRAPAGKHTGWAYCHVPSGCTQDMTDVIEGQIEKYAPGFKSVIQARHVMNSEDVERYNPNYVGGDINGGVQDIFQMFTRPAIRISPYTTPLQDVYICSSSTPPGGGVHGMCGFHAAKKAAGDHYNIKIQL